MTKSSLGASLILHALFLIPLVITAHCGGKGQFGENGDGTSTGEQDVNIVPKKLDGSDSEPEPPAPLAVELIEMPKPEATGVKECEGGRFYGGIGVIRDPMTNIISEVPPGYPANIAGILPGDRIISEGEIRGEPGTEVRVEIERAGEILVFILIREKICTST